MAKVIENIQLGEDTWMLSVEYDTKVKMGQFFMLRSWEYDPLLSRPLSVFDCQGVEIKFVYQKKGRGTERLKQLKKGDTITLHGPYGNGFPYLAEENISLIGGGLGVAPLYYTAKELIRINPEREVRIYLGFQTESKLTDIYKREFSNLKIDIGGFISDVINYNRIDTVYTCGPEVMMKKVFEMTEKHNIDLYASIERRMACGVGACLGCTCVTANGNKKACKDGPVFLGEDIFYEQIKK